MAEVTFKLVNKVYLYLSYYCSDGRLETSIGAKVTKKEYQTGAYTKPVARRISRLKSEINSYADKAKLANKPIYKSDIENIVIAELHTKKRISKTNKLHESFGRYYQMILNDELLNNGKLYSPSVKSTHRTLFNKWTALPKIANKALNDITTDDFIWLTNQMNNEHLAQNSVSMYILYLKTFFKRTYKRKWHTNKVFEDDDIGVGKDNIDMFVYLNNDDLQKIIDLDLSGNYQMDVTRDILIFGCYTGLRFSDLNRLDIKTLANGILSVDTQKRGKGVQIPVNSIVKRIWDKYGGNLPYRERTSFSDTIKKICKRAGIDEMCLYARTIGGERVNSYLPKWKMATSHIMRRSFATNAIKSGVPEVVIIKIMGITRDILSRYIKVTTQENVEIARGHEFFK